MILYCEWKRLLKKLFVISSYCMGFTKVPVAILNHFMHVDEQLCPFCQLETLAKKSISRAYIGTMLVWSRAVDS